MLTALSAVVAISLAYLLAGAGMEASAFEMTRMSRGQTAGQPASGGMAAMAPAAWSAGYALVMFFMWWIMMVAMMLPSAAPAILLFATVNRRQSAVGNPYVPTASFTFGYLAAWAGFSAVATALQWGLARAGLLSTVLVGTSPLLGATLLIAAGLYQLTPHKQACLRHCQSPVSFLGARWRMGRLGAVRMGLEHGGFCVGCCWFLMGLLFFGGVMNLYWITGVAIFVLLEKNLPEGHRFGYAAGIALIGWGLWIATSAF